MTFSDRNSKDGLADAPLLENCSEPKFSSDDPVNDTKRSLRFLWWMLWVFIVLEHIVVFWYARQMWAERLKYTVDGPLPYQDVPIRYKDITFASSAIHKSTDHQRTPYEGPRTTANDRAWDRIAEWSGFVGLSETEYSRLHTETFEHPQQPGSYVVLAGVFHQLHCLGRLRKHFWDWEDGKLTVRSDNETITHLDHCIGYLRQTLMCHADLTPATFEKTLNPEGNLVTNFAIKHRCRDFESILAWANHRQASLPDLGRVDFGH